MGRPSGKHSFVGWTGRRAGGMQALAALLPAHVCTCVWARCVHRLLIGQVINHMNSYEQYKYAILLLVDIKAVMRQAKAPCHDARRRVIGLLDESECILNRGRRSGCCAKTARFYCAKTARSCAGLYLYQRSKSLLASLQ